MKRMLFCCVVICLVFTSGAWAQTESINGYIHEIDGQRVMHVWGTPYEMGYAHGVLLGETIMQMMHEYVLYMLPPSLYVLVDAIAPHLFTIPESLRDEAEGIIAGIKASGADPMIKPIGREITVNDLLLCNAVGDIGAMACSCQMAWDTATADDPTLGGETAVARNLDWALFGPDRFLLPKNTMVMVFTPTDPPGRTVAMVSFPGYFGCLSCINDAGVTAVVNIAHNGIPLWEFNFSKTYIPIGFTLREALHQEDLNGDSVHNMDDVIDHILMHNRSGAVVINLAQPRDFAEGDPAVIVEVDSAGADLRLPEDDTDLPSNVLISTNDLRKLRHHRPCDRYDTMRDEIAARDGRLTLEQMWTIEGQVIQESFLSTTAQTIYYVPETREMGVSFSDDEILSPNRPPTILSWDEVAAMPPDDDVDDDDTVIDDDTGEIDDDTSNDNNDDDDDNEDNDDDSGCCG